MDKIITLEIEFDDDNCPKFKIAVPKKLGRLFDDDDGFGFIYHHYFATPIVKEETPSERKQSIIRDFRREVKKYSMEEINSKLNYHRKWLRKSYEKWDHASDCQDMHKGMVAQGNIDWCKCHIKVLINERDKRIKEDA